MKTSDALAAALPLDEDLLARPAHRARARLRGWVTRVRGRARVRSALPSPDVDKEAVTTYR